MSDITTLYRLFAADGSLLYVGISRRWPYRMERHSEQKAWWAAVTSVRLEVFPTRLEAEYAEGAAIRSEHPRHNIRHGRRPARPQQRQQYHRRPFRPSRQVEPPPYRLADGGFLARGDWTAEELDLIGATHHISDDGEITDLDELAGRPRGAGRVLYDDAEAWLAQRAGGNAL